MKRRKYIAFYNITWVKQKNTIVVLFFKLSFYSQKSKFT